MTQRRYERRSDKKLTPQQKRMILAAASVPFVGGLLLAGLLLFASQRWFDEASFYNSQGVDLAEEGKYGQAADRFTRAIELDPDIAEYHYNRGLAFALLEDYEAAIPDFSRAIALDETYTDAYYNRGMAYHAVGSYEAAIADYTLVMQDDPLFSEPYYRRGMSYEAQGEIALARADYEEYLLSAKLEYAEDAQARLDALK